jgi:hypothetical protein
MSTSLSLSKDLIGLVGAVIQRSHPAISSFYSILILVLDTGSRFCSEGTLQRCLGTGLNGGASRSI